MSLPLHAAIIWFAAGPPAPATATGGKPSDRFPTNACVVCHEQQAGRLGDLTRVEWASSVHSAAGVTCDSCHGGNASVRAEQFESPEAFKQASHANRDSRFLAFQDQPDRFVGRVRGREVSYFCGKCHGLVKEKHLGSPHGDNGDPTCLYCHARREDGYTTHAIQPASLDIIDTRGREEGGRCSPCHQAPTMRAVAQIRNTLAQTSAQIETAAAQYDALASLGYRSIELSGLHEHGREVLSRLRRTFHSFDMREINNFAGEIQSLAEQTARTHDLLERVHHMRRRQTVVGLAVSAFLLAFVALLLYYKHAFCLEHADTQSPSDRARQAG